MPRIVIVGVDKQAVITKLQAAGHTVEVLPSKVSEPVLKQVLLKGAEALLVDSVTNVPGSLITATATCGLKVVAVAGVNVSNIDVDACTRHGWMVCNSPDGFTASVAEFTISQILALSRHIPAAHASMLKGKWDRKDFMGKEMKGATIGIVGLGRIGRKVAEFAKGMGMKVQAVDPFVSKNQAHSLGVNLISIEELFATSDIATIHVPHVDTSRTIINADIIAKSRVKYLVSTSTATILDESAVAEALNSGKLKAAALDTFNVPFGANSPLRKSKNTYLSHEQASSSVEAQESVLNEAVSQVIAVLNGLPATHAVNLTSMRSELMGPVRPYMSIAERLGFLAATAAGDRGVVNVLIDYSGTLAKFDTAPLTLMILKGLLSFNAPAGSVNYVNAQVIAEQRGIRVRTTVSKATVYTSLISVKMTSSDGASIDVGGTFIPGLGDRIVAYNGIGIDLRPEGHMLFMESADVPGVLGGICTFLGSCNVNIATLDLGRVSPGGKAISGYNLDRGLTEAEMKKLLSQGMPVHSVMAINFPPLESFVETKSKL